MKGEEDQNPIGFTLSEIFKIEEAAYNRSHLSVRPFPIYLPTLVAEQLAKASRARQEANATRFEEEAKAAEQSKTATPKKDSDEPEPESWPKRILKDQAEAAKLSQVIPDPVAPTAAADYDNPAPPPFHVVFPYTPGNLAFLDANPGRGGNIDLKARDNAYRAALKASVTRDLTIYTAEKREGLDELKSCFPHFEPFFKLVSKYLHVDEPITLPPVLVAGEPGIGKSALLDNLAETLGLPIRWLHLSSELTNAVLLGSDSKWGNSAAGFVAEDMCLGRVGNPLYCVDDIHLARGQGEYEQSAISSLHSLLEPSAGGYVKDISIKIEIDATKISWIATTNALKRITASLLSRFRIVHVAPPTSAADCFAVTRSVARRIEIAQDVWFAKELLYEVAAISRGNARQSRMLLEDAANSAQCSGSNVVGLDQLHQTDDMLKNRFH